MNSQAGENSQQSASWVFTDLLSNSLKRLPQFSPGYEGMENMFYFLIVIYFDFEIEILIPNMTVSWETFSFKNKYFFIKLALFIIFNTKTNASKFDSILISQRFDAIQHQFVYNYS